MHCHRNSLRTELALQLEMPGVTSDSGLTLRAMTVIGQVIVPNLIPVTHDEWRFARGTESGVAFNVMHIASIHIMQAGT